MTDRRKLLQTVLGGGALAALVVPEKWARPVVRTIVVPAHAAASPATTAAPTTASPTTTLLGPSDLRLKRDIAMVGRLASGLPLYRYRYLWDDQEFVGVMAQEVIQVDRDAVVTGADGFLRVDYGRLGTRLMTWEQWRAQASTSH